MAFGVTTAIGFACAEKPPVGLMIAIQTNLSVTKDFDQLGLYITADGVPILTQTYQIEGGSVRLPSTIAIAVPKNPNAVIRVRAVAFKTDSAKVLREGITTVPSNRLAVLPLPLKWINTGSTKGTEAEFQVNPFAKNLSLCPDLETKENGLCTSSSINVDDLKDYNAAEIFGGSDTGSGGSCFDVATCFAQKVAVPVDDSTCTVVETPDMTNIAVSTSSGEGEPVGGENLVVLDDEDYSVSGNVISLPKTLCDPNGLKPQRKAIYLSPSCESKSSKYPICGPYSTGKPLPIVNDAGVDGSPPDGGSPIEQIGPSEPSVGVLAVGGGFVYGIGLDPNDAGAWRLIARGASPDASASFFSPFLSLPTPDFASTGLAAGPNGDLGVLRASDVSAALELYQIDGGLSQIGSSFTGTSITPFTASANRLYATDGLFDPDAGSGNLIDIVSFDKSSLSEPLPVVPQISGRIRAMTYATGPASDGGATVGYLFVSADGNVIRIEDPEGSSMPDLSYVSANVTKSSALTALAVTSTGKLVIAALGGGNALSLEVGDAFATTSLGKLTPIPTTATAAPFVGVSPNERYYGMTTDSKYVYFAHDAGIDYAPIDGSANPVRLVTSQGIYSVGTDGKFLYWVQARVGSAKPATEGFFRRPLVP